MILNRNQNVKDWTRYWPRLQSEKNNSFWCLLFIDVWFQDHDVWLWYCVFFPLWYKDYLLAKYSLYIVYYLHPSFHLPDWPRTKYMYTFPPQRKKYPVRVEACHCYIHSWSFVRILNHKSNHHWLVDWPISKSFSLVCLFSDIQSQKNSLGRESSFFEQKLTRLSRELITETFLFL